MRSATMAGLVFLAFGLPTPDAAAGDKPESAKPPKREKLAGAPTGFDVRGEGVVRGKLETVEYHSKTVGTRRKLVIHTPPEYTTDSRYPVLYLLHGIGEDERDWVGKGQADAILDNLYASRRLVPMIVVMPNGRAAKQDRPGGSYIKQFPLFAAFERELVDDVIPFIESHYPTKADREHRAIAGFSMGGGQSLNIGFRHRDKFASIGAFSSGPNAKGTAKLVANPPAVVQELKLVWISCGNRDPLFLVSQRVHAGLAQNNIPHLWHIDYGGHTWDVWKNDLYLLAPRLFRQ